MPNKYPVNWDVLILDLLPNYPKNGHFSTQKWPWMANVSILFILILYFPAKGIQLTRMRFFFKGKKLRADLLAKTLKIAIFH